MTGIRYGTAPLSGPELKSQLKADKGRWTNHRRACYQCRPGQNDPARYCDAGYRLAQAVHRAQAAVELIKARSDGEQGTLL